VPVKLRRDKCLSETYEVMIILKTVDKTEHMNSQITKQTQEGAGPKSATN
jgi:hypothetical protein